MMGKNCRLFPGQKVRIRVDEKETSAYRSAKDKRYITVTATVVDLYEHFFRVLMPAGYHQCFSYWDLGRTVRV